VKGLVVDVGGERSGGADGIEQGADECVDAAVERSERAEGAVDHEEIAGMDAERLELGEEGGASGHLP
jgi:hypothetical protein